MTRTSLERDRREPQSPPTYPVNMLLYRRPCLVVGAGNVAVGKVRRLVDAGADVAVVAPRIHPEIAGDDRVTWLARSYEPGDVVGYRLVITATDDPAVNAQVFRDGEAAGVLVNSADDLDNCAFTLPSVVQRGDLQVAVSTNGRSPALSAHLRRELEVLLGPEYEVLLNLLADARDELRTATGTSEVPGWREALAHDLPGLIRRDRTQHARALIRDHLSLPEEALV